MRDEQTSLPYVLHLIDHMDDVPSAFLCLHPPTRFVCNAKRVSFFVRATHKHDCSALFKNKFPFFNLTAWGLSGHRYKE